MSSAPTIDETYGAMLIGLLIATFLQGLLTVQMYHYYCNFQGDIRINKILVATVWTLDLIHLIFIAHATWYFIVANWGNPAVLSTSTVLLNLHLPLVGIITLLCQCYFLHRVWILTDGNIPIVAFLSSLCVATMLLGLFITVKILQDLSVATFYRYRYESIPQFIIGAAADIGIAAILVFYLDRGKGELQSTNNVISKLLRNAVATGTVTSVLAVACTITYLAKPQTLIFVSMHFSMGRMYTNALLATLNSRKAYRPYFGSVVLSRESRSDHRGQQQTTFACAMGPVDTAFTNVNVVISKHSAIEEEPRSLMNSYFH
ncbi:hypothetical protein BDN72DRAFT_831801, partial [Pluteus cervinus]